MATLTPTLTLSSTDATSDSLSISLTDSLTTAAPSVGLSQIIATATGGDHVILPAATGVRYLYVRHTGLTGADATTASAVGAHVDIENADGVACARLAAGEFCFFPVAFTSAASKAFNLQVAEASNVLMEYAYWTKG